MIPTMSITVTVPNLSGLAERVRARVEAVVEATAKAAAEDVKASMNHPGTGRTYRIGDVTRPLRKSERPGMTVWGRQGQMVMRTASGYRAKVNAAGTGVNVVIGARIHRASAPGEPPTIDTSELVNSIRAAKLGQFRWEVAPHTEYAGALEYGNPARGLAPRPYLRPALERARAAFVAAIQEAIRP